MKGDLGHCSVLVIDLDGTLIRSDMLLESFWAAFSGDRRAPLAALASLVAGRAALKRRMARMAAPDPSTLPYNETVLDYIRSWREAGGRAVLVSAADAQLVQAVADHLGLFDEAHGSDGHRNLKGPEKARFVTGRFGAGGYAYVGDSEADLPVWEAAGRAVTVGAGAGLRRRVEALGGTVEHLPEHPGRAGAALRALRPHQWLKNLLIFMPMLAGHDFTTLTAMQSIVAFSAFCLVASSVYLINDLLDLTADRAHPRKRDRPLASGALPIGLGTAMAPALFAAGLAVALTLGGRFVLVLLGYFALTALYSLWLKRLVIADILTLAVLYTTRIVAGAVATGLPLSVWILAFAIFFFLAMAAVKRQAELVDTAARGQLAAAGRGYHADDLPLVSQMATTSGYVSVLVMALYLNSPTVQDLYSRPPVLWGICLVLLYWISNIVMVTHRGSMDDDPIVYALKDRTSQICILLVLALAWGATLS